MKQHQCHWQQNKNFRLLFLLFQRFFAIRASRIFPARYYFSNLRLYIINTSAPYKEFSNFATMILNTGKRIQCHPISLKIFVRYRSHINFFIKQSTPNEEYENTSF